MPFRKGWNRKKEPPHNQTPTRPPALQHQPIIQTPQSVDASPLPVKIEDPPTDNIHVNSAQFMLPTPRSIAKTNPTQYEFALSETSEEEEPVEWMSPPLHEVIPAHMPGIVWKDEDDSSEWATPASTDDSSDEDYQPPPNNARNSIPIQSDLIEAIESDTDWVTPVPAEDTEDEEYMPRTPSRRQKRIRRAPHRKVRARLTSPGPLSVHDLPFMDQFKSVSSLPLDEQEVAVNGLTAQAMDVDRWEITMSPDQYLLEYPTPLASVTLASYSPRGRKKNHDDVHANWMLLATGPHQIFFDPDYQAGFFMALSQFITTAPTGGTQRAVYGSPMVHVGVLVFCLKAAGCTAIRLKLYGQKTPLDGRFITREPAPGHPLSYANEWDLAVSFVSNDIWLFQPKNRKTEGLRHFAVMTPASMDFGTVNFKTTYRAHNYAIKVYPRIVHVLKSQKYRMDSKLPKLSRTLRARMQTVEEVIQAMALIPPNVLGGLRIEVSVRAPTLEHAQQLVLDANLLNPSTWLQPNEDPVLGQFALQAKLVSKEGFLANARWLLGRASALNVFIGSNVKSATRLQHRAIADLFSSIGWNHGRWHMTRSASKRAWWTLEQLPPDVYAEHPVTAPEAVLIPSRTILSQLVEIYPDAEALLEKTRSLVDLGHVPCRQAPSDTYHWYHVQDRNPLRLKCKVKACHHSLTSLAMYEWIASLIQNGRIGLTAMGLRPPRFGSVGAQSAASSHSNPFLVGRAGSV